VSARGRVLLWAPVALLLAFEFWLSSRTSSEMPALGPWFDEKDKVEHAVYFFLTGLLAVRAARFGERWGRVKTAVFLVLAAILWGCSDEIHQSFTPDRSVEIGDVLADVLGVALAATAGEPILRRLGLDRTIA
jgi:VanZ family protein